MARKTDTFFYLSQPRTATTTGVVVGLTCRVGRAVEGKGLSPFTTFRLPDCPYGTDTFLSTIRQR